MLKQTKFLDTFRGLAAIYVLIYHGRWLLTENFHYRLFDSNFEKFLAYFFSVFKFGHQAVIFFFVLSGFVIHYSTLNKNNNFSWSIYFKKRANRIFFPLLVALVITFICDYIGKNIANLTMYQEGSKYLKLAITDKNSSFFIFLGNLLNLQGLIPKINIYGSNGALWSLSYEWWFYLFYPIFFFINSKNRLLALGVQLTLFIIFSYCFQTYLPIPIITPIFQKMIIWWSGVILAEIVFRKKNVIKIMPLLILLIPIALIYLDKQPILIDVFWGLGFVGILAVFFLLKTNSKIIAFLSSKSDIGDYSFTMYLIHVPLIYFVHALLIEETGELPKTYIWLLLFTFCMIKVSKVIAPIIEKKNIFKI